MPKKVAIILPCYNEAQTIGPTIKQCLKAFPQATIYVYNNNSTDDTVKEAQKFTKSNKVIIRTETTQGKGAVIRSAFMDIEADAYLMMDADNTYNAQDCQQLVDDVLNNGIDMAIGDRLSGSYHSENKRSFHSFGNNLVKNLINKLFKSNIHDAETGGRCFSKRYVKTYPGLEDGFGIEPEMNVHALTNKFKVSEHVIGYQDRPEGSESKLNTFKDGWVVLLTIFTLFKNERPMLLFSALLAPLLWLFALIPGGIVLDEWFNNNHIVTKFPTLIVFVILIFTGIICFFSGLIMDLIKNKHRQQLQVVLKTIKF